MTTISSTTDTSQSASATPASASGGGYYRAVAAVALVAAALTSLAWTLTAPEFPSAYDDRLAAIADSGTAGLVSAALFAASQLPMLVALLALARLARNGAPRASAIGATLGVVGVLGHAVFGGVALVSVILARDTANRAIHADVLEAVESTPAIVPFMAAGLLGTVLGFLVLGVALYRSRAVPRWIPALLWVFLVVEFVGSNVSDYATYVSGACLLIAFTALAREVANSPRSLW